MTKWSARHTEGVPLSVLVGRATPEEISGDDMSYYEVFDTLREAKRYAIEYLENEIALLKRDIKTIRKVRATTNA